MDVQIGLLALMVNIYLLDFSTWKHPGSGTRHKVRAAMFNQCHEQMKNKEQSRFLVFLSNACLFGESRMQVNDTGTNAGVMNP